MNQQLFADAYEIGFVKTVRFLQCKGACVEEAEEIAQSAWVRGWEAREQLKSDERVIPWVNSIAYHRFCNDRRRLARRTTLKEVTDSSAAPKTAPVDAGALLSKCSNLDRTLLEERYYNDLSMNEIGSRHGMTAGAVRVRIHRCQSSLRAITRDSRWRFLSNQAERFGDSEVARRAA
jgi:DNA-directed RNA polymerase specialized sigma24 family protein